MIRDVVCADSLTLLPTWREIGAIVTSLPDADEIGMPVRDYRDWFVDAASLCLRATARNAATVFFQTDRRANGEILSKSRLLMVAAATCVPGTRLLWHKIVLRRPPGALDLYRPTYSHLIAFSQEARVGLATPDVIPPSAKLYDNAIPLLAAKAAVMFALRHTNTIVDPFCGHGTVLAVAESYGARRAIGIDIDPAQCARAQHAILQGILDLGQP